MSTTSGTLTVFGDYVKAIEAEGEHAAQGGAIAASVTGKRVANFTSGQGIVYGLEQYYPAPGKLSTMVLNVGARALTKHALNVHCGHDDFNAALDTGWILPSWPKMLNRRRSNHHFKKNDRTIINPGHEYSRWLFNHPLGKDLSQS